MADHQINATDSNEGPVPLGAEFTGGKVYPKQIMVSATGTPIDFNTYLTALNNAVALLVGVETTVTPSSATLSAGSAGTLFAVNASRVRAMIHNRLGSPLYVRKAALATSAATASPGGYDFVVFPGAVWTSDVREWAGAMNAICASAGTIGLSESV